MPAARRLCALCVMLCALGGLPAQAGFSDEDFPDDDEFYALTEDEEFLSYFFRELARYAVTGESRLPFAGRYLPYAERIAALYQRGFVGSGGGAPEIAGRLPGMRSFLSVLFPSLHDDLVRFSLPPLPDEDSDGIDLPGTEEETADGENMEASEEEIAAAARLRYKYSGGALRLMASGDEYTALYRGIGGTEEAVQADSGKIIRSSYDTSGRLLRRERYENARSSRGIRLLWRIRYRYPPLPEDGGFDTRPPVFAVEESFEDNSVQEYAFDQDGRPSARRLFLRVPAAQADGGTDAAQDVQEWKKIPVEVYAWKYDGEGRMTEEDYTLYVEVPDKRRKNVSRWERVSYRTVYEYTGAAPEPDTEYYENGILRSKTVYRADGDYEQTSYFDGGFSVRAEYRDGVLEAEQVFFGGKPAR